MQGPESTTPHIGPFLRHVRNLMDLTLREAANVTHVNFTYLAQVERGERNPSAEWLAAYVKALGTEAAAKDSNDGDAA